MTDYRNISMWHDTAGDEWNPRPSLPGPTEVDVAIIGAGFTGLWTAYYLKKTDPSLRIAVVEKEVAGFGPSGRNGGWCSQLFATPLHKLAKDTDRQSAIAQHRAMFDTVKAKITHRWGGPVGLPRDWYSSVGLDRSSGIAWAGGYVGDGVSTTNLA